MSARTRSSGKRRRRAAVAALGYASVRNGGGLDGPEIEAQRAGIEDACGRMGLELVSLVSDHEPEGGGERPGLSSALERIDSGEASCLIVNDLERLSRQVGELATVIDLIERRKVRLIALDVGLDTATPSGRLAIEPIEGAVIEDAAIPVPPASEAAVKAPVQDASVDEAPAEQAPAEPAPVGDGLVEPASVKEPPAEEAAIEGEMVEPPVEEAAIEGEMVEPPVEEAAIEGEMVEAPVEEAAFREPVAAEFEAPVATPHEKPSVDDKPEVEQAPVEQAPVEQRPVEQRPVEVAPADAPDETARVEPPAEPARAETPAPAPEPDPVPAAATPPADGARPPVRAVVMALGYASVPADGNVAQDLDEQKLAIERDAERLGFKVVEVVREREPKTGRALDRAGLSYLIGRIAAGDASCVVVSALDKLSRSVAELGTIVQWLERNGVRLIAADIGLDTATAGGRTTALALASVAKWEHERVSERTRSGLAAARAKRRAAAGPDWVKVRERIATMRADGMTLQAIADVLNAEGVPTQRGGAEWRPSSVQTAAGYKRRTRAEKLEDLPSVGRPRPAPDSGANPENQRLGAG